MGLTPGFNVDFAGTGAATTVARSDHFHDKNAPGSEVRGEPTLNEIKDAAKSVCFYDETQLTERLDDDYVSTGDVTVSTTGNSLGGTYTNWWFPIATADITTRFAVASGEVTVRNLGGNVSGAFFGCRLAFRVKQQEPMEAERSTIVNLDLLEQWGGFDAANRIRAVQTEDSSGHKTVTIFAQQPVDWDYFRTTILGNLGLTSIPNAGGYETLPAGATGADGAQLPPITPVLAMSYDEAALRARLDDNYTNAANVTVGITGTSYDGRWQGWWFPVATADIVSQFGFNAGEILIRTMGANASGFFSGCRASFRVKHQPPMTSVGQTEVYLTVLEEWGGFDAASNLRAVQTDDSSERKRVTLYARQPVSWESFRTTILGNDGLIARQGDPGFETLPAGAVVGDAPLAPVLPIFQNANGRYELVANGWSAGNATWSATFEGAAGHNFVEVMAVFNHSGGGRHWAYRKVEMLLNAYGADPLLYLTDAENYGNSYGYVGSEYNGAWTITRNLDNAGIFTITKSAGSDPYGGPVNIWLRSNSPLRLLSKTN